MRASARRRHGIFSSLLAPSAGPLMLLVAASSGAAGAETFGPQEVPLEISEPVTRLALADLDGDRRVDIVLARPTGLEVWYQGREADRPFTREAAVVVPDSRPAGAASIGWDVADLEGDGHPVLVEIRDGRELLSLPVDPGTRRFLEPRLVLGGLGALVPAGLHHLPFVRDIDGDGDGDLVIPRGGEYHLYARRSDGSYGAAVEVPLEAEWTLELDADGNLKEEVGHTMTLPLFSLRDLNGDGRLDLFCETEDELRVHLATAGEQVFAPEASFRLDLAAERDKLGRFEPEDLDFSNLTGFLSRTVQAFLADVNVDGIEDLMLRAGGRFLLFLGRTDGIELDRPQQVLRSSGNVLVGFCADEDGDGRLDLWIVRVETVSIGDVFVWLVASGSMDFELFIYRNEGGRFGRRPARRITVTLSFPSIRSMLDGSEWDRGPASAGVDGEGFRADLTGRGHAGDIVVARDGRLEFFVDPPVTEAKGGAPSIPGRAGDAALLVLGVLEALGYSRERDAYEIDLRRLRRLVSREAGGIAGAVEGATPAATIQFFRARRPQVVVRDLDGDGRDDVLAITSVGAEGLRGSVIFSR